MISNKVLEMRTDAIKPLYLNRSCNEAPTKKENRKQNTLGYGDNRLTNALRQGGRSGSGY